MDWPRLSKLLRKQQHRRYFGRKESTEPQGTIIVPLYIYPAPGAWEPLYESFADAWARAQDNIATGEIVTHKPDFPLAITAVRDLFIDFLPIAQYPEVPKQSLPDANYLGEIPKLTRYTNVDVVGYVHTTFAQRNITAVINDIDTYSRWAGRTQHPGLEVHGIFVDETPNQHDARAEVFLKEITEFAKSCSGIRRNRLVIHNPGCAASPTYMALADLNVVFEDTWQTFNTRFDDGVFNAEELFGNSITADQAKIYREKLAVMIHSVPKDLTTDTCKVLVGRARQISRAVFVTDLDVNYYSEWSLKWMDWVKMIGSM